MGLGLGSLACGDRDVTPSAPGTDAPDTAENLPPVFADATEKWGVDFENACRFTGEYVLAEIMGQGVVIFDANGDGRLDLYFANGGPVQGDSAPDRLFIAQPDEGYRDATAESGLDCATWTTGVGAADLDNDGDVDLYVGSWGRDRLYRNEGDGTFVEITDVAGIAGDHLTTSVAFLDFDLDGFLDIFVAHYVIPNPDRTCGSIGGGREYCGPAAYTPVPDTLYRNRGDGTFEDASAASGIAGEAASGLGVAVSDFDGDGLLDVYVANDQRPNHLWRNGGDGTFSEVAIRMGVALSGRGNAEASMGVDVADVNGDGWLDIFITHIAGETNTLYLGGATGAFRDASVMSGVGTPSREMTAFGTVFADVDLDGAVDLLVANGRVSQEAIVDGADAPGELARYAERNVLLFNDGAGQFSKSGGRAGAFAKPVHVSRGLASADLDGDGDLDVIVTNVGSPVRLYENVAPRTGHWLVVTAWDHERSRIAVGARVEVTVGERTHVGLSGAGWSYLSGSAPDAHFGLGDAERVDAITIVWPGGERESFPGADVDRVVRLERGTGSR